MKVLLVIKLIPIPHISPSCVFGFGFDGTLIK